MQLEFKKYIEGLNSPGRAGQHFWNPESPVNFPTKDYNSGNKHVKGVKLDLHWRPMQVAPFRGVTAKMLNPNIIIKKISK